MKTLTKIRLKSHLKAFIYALLAGIMIGVGGVINLSCDNKYIGSFLFGLGLFTILTFGFNLYTGKIGYAVNNKLSDVPALILIWLGNLVGTLIVGLSVQFTRVGQNLTEKAQVLCEVKLNDDLLSIFVLSFFCGLLMFVAADGYKNLTNQVAQIVAVFLPVMVFILSGFEHCVANMFYFTVSNMWNWQSAGWLLVMTAGNSIGGMLIPWTRKCFIKS